MYLVAFGQEKFGQIGAILSCNAGTQCFLHELFPLVMVQKRNGTLICMIWSNYPATPPLPSPDWGGDCDDSSPNLGEVGRG